MNNGELAAMELIPAVLSIVLIDIVLSGDNALIIGLAAHRLPPAQRRLAIVMGGGAAIVLRVVLTAVAALLLALPALKAIGGLLLLWIAFKLLKQGQASVDGVKAGGAMRDAILTILLADVIMSLDNVLGVAAASEGNLGLLVFGLALSMAILLAGGSLVAHLVHRLPWLTYLGTAAIAWIGAGLILEDDFLAGVISVPPAANPFISALLTVCVLALGHYKYRRISAAQPATKSMVASGTEVMEQADLKGSAGSPARAVFGRLRRWLHGFA